jgi:hypothetical protein
MVAPGYLAGAAARTLLAVSPLSSRSSGRWLLSVAPFEPVAAMLAALWWVEWLTIATIVTANAVSVATAGDRRAA